MLPDHQSAAELLALAVTQLFPKTLLLQGEGTESLFFYDFVFSEPFSPESLPLIEERMRQLAYKGIRWDVKEMVAKNAAALFEHCGQSFLAAQFKAASSLIQVVRAEGFADWCEKEIALEWAAAPHFKLVESFPVEVEDRVFTRLIGFFSFDRDALKKRVKSAPRFALRNHQRGFKDKGFFTASEGVWTWLPPANDFLTHWRTWWERECDKRKIKITHTPAGRGAEDWRMTHRGYWKLYASEGACRLAEMGCLYGSGEERVKNGLFEALAWIGDRGHLFIPNEKVIEECISSLQFIMEIPKILGFEFRVVLYTPCGGTQKNCDLLQVLKEVGLPYRVHQGSRWGMESRIQFQIADSLGGWWEGPFLAIDLTFKLRKGWTCVIFSVFNSMERLIALCAEQGKLKEL